MTESRVSYRDPAGSIFLQDNKVYRSVMPIFAYEYRYVRESGLISKFIADGKLVAEQEVDCSVLSHACPDAKYVLEHPRLKMISYPYEWTFSMLQDAALLYLSMHIEALAKNVTLKDASAYNIQFEGAKPIFIDHLTFTRYQEGDSWEGHQQFYDEFLNPLLLSAFCRVPYEATYRGNVSGISSVHLSHLLSFLNKLRFRVFLHVVLPAILNKKQYQSFAKKSISQKKKKFSKPAFIYTLSTLRKWIKSLTINYQDKSNWKNYAEDNSYNEENYTLKKRFIQGFVNQTGVQCVWDFGCNTGDFSIAALEAGANTVIGFDSDHCTLEVAYQRAKSKKLSFTPLFMELTNPTPSQGWANHTLLSIEERANADGLLALALIHHLVITSNIPLSYIIRYLTNLAPKGVIEFVPEADPMAKELLALKKSKVVPNYNRNYFESELVSHAKIIKQEQITESGRRLYWYEK